MQRHPRLHRYARHAIAAAAALVLAAAQAQVSTATIKGQVTGAAAAATISAVNQANGTTYRTTVRPDGSYVLAGLAPGSYEVRAAGGTGPAQVVTVSVGETAAIDLSLGGQVVQITGSGQRQDVKGSEVGTLVSRRLIDALPQVTRNFLSSADLAPGVRFETDQSGNTKVQSGALNRDSLNVFIDGVSQKNNILRGGLVGQDSTRGNPFPQSAIGEYRVITQNYKAEYDQVSGTAITAVTRSGGNTLSGDAYVDRTGTSWREKSVFEKEREAAGAKLDPSTKTEYGFSLGGPIQKDAVHFFMAFDGKRIEDSRQVVPKQLDAFASTAGGLVSSIRSFTGTQVDTFKEGLFFGKVDAQLNPDMRLSASLRVRKESDRTPESRDLSAPGNDSDKSNDETRFDLKHEWAGTGWLNEARIGYEDARWHPHSASTDPFFKYKVSRGTTQLLSNNQDVIFMGGSPNAQDRSQKGTLLSNDYTYTGLGGHVLKGGAKVKFMSYDLGGTAFGVDTVEVLLDRLTGNPYYAGGLCTGTAVTNGGLNSDQCKISRAIAPSSANFDNTQWGLYLQDDWTVSKKLEVNLGLRWDYESNMLNNDYVTPADRVAAIRALDGERWGIKPPAGQTYAQSLAKGGVNIDEYIATGGSRKAFKGALAPRVGFSYDVGGDRSHVIFGGYGRSYDRTMANHALDEKQKNAQAGGEIWMIKNDYKMPYTDQFSIGLRQALGAWNGEFAISRVEGHNQFQWFSGNRDANGGYATQSSIDPLWGGPNGYGSLILGDTIGRSRTDSLLVRMEKPYTRASGWTATVAYTYSDAKTTHKEWNDDIFDWTYGKGGGVRGWNPSTLVATHRVVAAGMADTVLPWGLAMSAKLTWDSGLPRRLTDCSKGFSNCVYQKADTPDFQQVDISLSKAFTFGSQSATIRLDVLNLFNKTNYGGWDDWVGGPGNPQNALGGDNPNLGKPNSIRGDTRTFRLALAYKF